MDPEVVIVLKTWQGRSKEVGAQRLAYLGRTIAALERNLGYPNYSWHIADDGSEEWYVDAVLRMLGDRAWTWSSSEANGDIGRNLNVGLRVAFSHVEVVLNWSDDIFLQVPLDIEPYVDLLVNEPSIGYVVTRPGHPTLDLAERSIRGRVWYEVGAASHNKFLMVTSLNLMHKRAWDFYGPYPEGLRIDIMQEEMAWRYRRFSGGPKIVIPEELVEASRVSYGGLSTWDWQLEEEGAWYRYRSYSARQNNGRHLPATLPGAH